MCAHLASLFCHTGLVLVILAAQEGCGAEVDSRAPDGPTTLAQRLTDTTWSCNLLAMAPPWTDWSDIQLLEIPHTLSFTATTMNDDFPYRLSDFRHEGDGENTYRGSIVGWTGFVDGAGLPIIVFDDVPWSAVSDDEIMVASMFSPDSDYYPMTGGYNAWLIIGFKWDSQGMTYRFEDSGHVFARCTRTSPPAEDSTPG